MLYVKEKVSYNLYVTVEIHDDNMFCSCHECGSRDLQMTL